MDPLTLESIQDGLSGRDTTRRRRMLLAGSIVLATAMVLSCTTVRAQAPRPSDREVMAAYLFNFGRFATWPSTTASADGTFGVCILGHDPFGTALEATLAGETIDGRNAAVRRLAGLAEVDESCRILFIAASEEREWPKIAKAIEDLDVLTVSDMPDFIGKGGMIQFILQSKRIRFEVNLTAVEQGHVRLSSELLKVAAAVRRPAGSGA